MAEEPKTPAEKTPAPLVDLDAGGSWGIKQIELGHPFILEGVTYRSIEMRVPSGMDILRWNAGKVTLAQWMVGLTALDEKVFNAMHGKDVAVCLAEANGFLE